MKATPEWVHEPDAAELLHIKACTLRNKRRERRLDAGTHWVYIVTLCFWYLFLSQ